MRASALDPTALAVVRIALFSTIALRVDVADLAWFASLPRDLIFPPVGSGWAVRVLPPSPGFLTAAALALKAGAFLAAAGAFTRTTSLLTTLLGAYVLLVPQLYGKVDHYHHIVWFAAILSASKCGDALSVDAWLKRRQGRPDPRPSSDYYWPLASMWVLLGVVYFFPGLWKLLVSGFGWALSDNLKYQMYAKWFELGGWLPFFRLDQYPILYRAAGVYTMLFELSFVFLVLHARTRQLAALAGVLFHLCTGLFMNIWFTTLIVAYTAFVDWESALRRIRRRPAQPDASLEAHSTLRGPGLALMSVAAILFVGGIWAGTTKTEAGWPFASYPSFTPARTAAATGDLLVTRAASRESSDEDLLYPDELYGRLGPARYTGLVSSLLAVSAAPERQRRLQAFGQVVARETGGLQEGSVVRIYSVIFDTTPTQGEIVVLSRALIGVWEF